MKIMEASKEDLKDILCLSKGLFEYERKFGTTYNLGWTYSDTGKNYFKKRISDKNGIVIVAKKTEKIVGYLCGFVDNYSFRSVNPIAEIENMFIVEEFRRKNIGTALIKEFEDLCKKKGVRRLRVGTSVRNDKALGFYKTMGYDGFELFLEKDI